MGYHVLNDKSLDITISMLFPSSILCAARSSSGFHCEGISSTNPSRLLICLILFRCKKSCFKCGRKSPLVISVSWTNISRHHTMLGHVGLMQTVQAEATTHLAVSDTKRRQSVANSVQVEIANSP